jgi:hypothetical protein
MMRHRKVALKDYMLASLKRFKGVDAHSGIANIGAYDKKRRVFWLKGRNYPQGLPIRISLVSSLVDDAGYH